MARRITRGMVRNNGRNGIGHPSSWRYYAVVNSRAGLRYMLRVLRKYKIDVDTRKTKDGVIVVNHGHPEGKWYWDGDRRKPIRGSIETLTLAQVRHLVHESGYTIDTLAEHMAAASADTVGRRPVFIIEPKGLWTFADPDEVRRKVVAPARQFGIGLGGYVLRQNNRLRSDRRRQVAIMNLAGIRTTELSK